MLQTFSYICRKDKNIQHIKNNIEAEKISKNKESEK